MTVPSFIIVGYVWRILGRGSQKDPPPICEQPILNGLSSLKIFLSFSRKPFHWVPLCLCFKSSSPQFYSINTCYAWFFKSLSYSSCKWLLLQKRKLLWLLSWIISEAAVLRCSKIFEEIAKKTSLVEWFCW